MCGFQSQIDQLKKGFFRRIEILVLESFISAGADYSGLHNVNVKCCVADYECVPTASFVTIKQVDNRKGRFRVRSMTGRAPKSSRDVCSMTPKSSR